ncbi:EAL domain-containing protein [Paenibacillus sp. NPDC056579]|uniref:bifunctional diguanylate cyclase/phosphodiesterase n=1 Tax=unclassified Paenibacillus TaxID=185978 RepID=UPI001EF76B5D|nr:bifunctional diguanylate cyclase/phosphodiesterase [Paenibacillus sp. H1-7]ULL13600.1 bifunctional diguanylate cyclase/phosphodiesterase [Paenibacillus sp. H1-7]
MDHLHAHYNGWIILLSFIIAIMASYSALNLAGKISRSRGKSRLVWLLAGSCVMGCGIWSMHFVGMLAFHIELPVHYDAWTTLLSALAGILASFIAFRATMDTKVNKWRLGIGGLFMGSGIVVMHYSGMSAMRTAASLTYEPGLWTLSVIVALVACYAALYLFRKFRLSPDYSRWKLLSSVVMAIAVCGMHYIGMAAVRFIPYSDMQPAGLASDAEPRLFLLIGVSLAALVILAISWGAIFFDRHVLERMAYSDPLTGLANRHDLTRFFEEQFTPQAGGAVFFIDLDRFKSINDTLGHDIGDLLIREVSQRLQQTVSDKQTVFRLGGDEFLIASRDGSEDTVRTLAEALLNEIKKPYFIEENELYVTASIGISLSPQHGTDRSSLLKAADTAMYNAKAAGKNRFRIFDEQMDREMIRKMELEKDLRKALAHQEFFAVYQPKCDASTNQMVGMEALLRWRHPTLGIISPVEFIPIAEDTGLIIPITHWLLKEVCKQNSHWQEQQWAQLCVSVNMSVRMFESQALYDMVQEALTESGLQGKYLELEITESIAMHDSEDTVQQLYKLRELGVRVSLDDFGTGYSSLGTLDEMPVDTLKIDQIFVRKSQLLSKQAIISNIIAIAKNLNLEVIAEGVETEEQIQFLQSRGCHVMQGYYYGKPMTADEIGLRLNKLSVG